MRFAAYRQNGTDGIAVAKAANSAFHARSSTDPRFPGTLTTLLAAGTDALQA